ncbi:putative phylloplanin [Helianthus debilis subsp. tardiflorus]
MYQAIGNKHTNPFTSMAMKSIILINLLVVVLVATQAKARVSPPPFNLFSITGNVSCSLSGNIVVNGTTITPPFPNALVQLICRRDVISSTITNGVGGFSIIVTDSEVRLATLLRSCNVVVASPLSACNASLPSSGSLQSPLELVGTIRVGILNITNVLARAFRFVRD